MKFITYNDSPGGIYQSQVIDVCHFLQTQFNTKVDLIAFVSLRTFFKDRKQIKKAYKNTTVLPSYPGIKNWRKNLRILQFYMLFKKHDRAITRGVFATHLALNCKKLSSICFDARGAYDAEWKEYLSKESTAISTEIHELEKQALLNADFRIAISSALITYWKKNYGYEGNNHVIIPCTIDSSLAAKISSADKNSRQSIREKLGVNNIDILLVFSGSSAAWQSMESLYQILGNVFAENNSLKLLLLTKDSTENKLSNLFPDRVIRSWVEPPKVYEYLQAADYGLLYREDSITNNVSSPVKFAEYIASGLPVIISEKVGDYSSFVAEKNCGMLFNSVHWNKLKCTEQEEKNRIQKIALTYLTKSAYFDSYKKVIEMK